MTKFYKGIAGARGSAPLGIVFHNDAGSQNANANFYRNWLPTHDAENGFAHYYVASDGIYQAEDEKNMAWHTANSNGNANYIGIEICQSMGDEKTFRENEQKAFKLGAEICKRYGWVPNYNLFPLHKEFSSTSCPHRSSELHGQSVQAVRQYFTDQVMKYYKGQGNANTPTNNKGENSTSGGYKVEPYNVRQVTDVALNVRTSPNTQSNIVRTLPQGYRFNATRIVRNGENVNGYTTWCEVDGVGWVSMAYTSPINAVPTSPQRVSASGRYTVKYTTNIRSAPSTSASIVGSYAPGESFNYDSYIDTNGYRWYSYISYSGQRRYVAKVD